MTGAGADYGPIAVQRPDAGASKTLQRGLDLIEAVARGDVYPSELIASTGLTFSTTHRIAGVLVERGYLVPIRRGGYRLGPAALQIGFEAQRQLDLIPTARPHLQALAAVTRDTVSLVAMSGSAALHLDVIPGRRRTIVRRRVGERQSLESAIGRALLNGEVAAGEEEAHQIFCTAAPVQDITRNVVAAIVVSSPAGEVDEVRRETLQRSVRDAASALSHDLGLCNLRARPAGRRGAP